MSRNILDRYLLREWVKIFSFTAIGFPVLVILIDLTDNLDDHLARGIEAKAMLLGYVYSLPDQIFRILPAAVLFATVFTLGSFSRHSELVATKASGRSFRRVMLPVMAAAFVVAGAGVVLGEIAPQATRRQLELHGELEVRSRTSRQNFIYRAEDGWVYSVRTLNISQNAMYDVIMEREGAGAYPTLVVQAKRARYLDSTTAWTLSGGLFRIMAEPNGEEAFQFDSLRTRNLVEAPADLLVEPKKPEEMTYLELGRYIEALERSGGDGRKLSVQRALKFAVPVTCIIIALFGGPLAVTAPRASGAMGVAISLGTTVVFLLFIQLSQAIATAGILPPDLAAWLPNILFGTVGLWLLKNAPT